VNRLELSYAIVFVSDMARSVLFYRDVLGLPLRFESPQWTEFVTGGATLALHRAGGTAAGQDDARQEAAGRCRPGLRVRNLDDFHDRMARHGVACLQEPKEVFGARVAQYADPDGLVISVGEDSR
jgi:lactoylglutathione lyase